MPIFNPPQSGGVTGTGVANRVAYWTGASTIDDDSIFSFNPTKKQLGVGVSDTASEAAGHFKADTALTISPLASASSSLTLFTLLDQPSTYNTSQSSGHLYAATGFSGSSSGGSSSYSGGDSIDYRITAYNNDSGTIFSVVNSITNVVIGTTGDDVGLSWTDNFGGTESISGYVIERNINGGGYNDGIDVGLTTNYTDTSVGWSSVSLNPTYPDFIATGAPTRNYDAYSSALDPTGLALVFSQTSINSGFDDDATGNPYLIQHFVIPGSGGTSARIVYSTGSTYADGTNFLEGTNTFISGTTVTPNTFGVLSDSSYWNKNFDFYNFSAALGIYSTGLNRQTTDPNDGNYYYVVAGFTGQTTSAKVIQDSTSSITSATSPVIYNGSNWSGNTTVTPTSATAYGGMFETHGSSISDKATIVSKSLDGSYSRLDFQNAASTRLGYLEQTSSYNRFSVPSQGFLSYQTTDRFRWDGSGISFFAAATASQQANTTDLGVILSNFGLRVAGTAYPITTSGTITFTDNNIVLGTTTGTKFGTATTQKLAFYNSTPIVQPTGNIITALSNLGLVNTPTLPASSVSSGAALTKTDDTNVTLTLGGTPTTALLVAASLTLGWTGTLGVARGGTNIASYAVGDLLYASGSTTLSKLADVATGNALISGGVTTAPSWGKIGLTTHVSGTLPVANGGTGQATPVVIAASVSTTGTATTTFTVTIGTTQANATYKVNVTPTSLVAAAVFYVNNKTTTTFDVVYLAGLTGAVSFDWALFT